MHANRPPQHHISVSVFGLAVFGLMALLASQRGSLFRLSAEWLEQPSPKLSVTSWTSDGSSTALLAHCDDHGRWVEWLA